MHKLICSYQNYKWGKQSETSLVAEIIKSHGAEIKQKEYYAEYWMGAHENLPSYITIDSKLTKLSDYLKALDSPPLPFLFKVLSIEKPLSIQIHPDRLYAKYLNEKYPELYKESNHKPELAIVLSDTFETFYGFKDIGKTVEMLLKCNELTAILKKGNTVGTILESFLAEPNALSHLDLVVSILRLEHQEVKAFIDHLLQLGGDIGELVRFLHGEFPYDRGVLVGLFMNRLRLKRGDTLFIVANIPHSYISGDIMECMASSDFVIRIGLTPKVTDMNAFCMILKEKYDYVIKESNRLLDNRSDLDPNCRVFFREEYNEFAVYAIDLDDSEYLFKTRNNSVLFVLLADGLAVNNIEVQTYGTFFIEKEIDLRFKGRGKVFISSSL